MLFSNHDVILQSEGGGGEKRPKNCSLTLCMVPREISHKAHAYQPGMTRGCDLDLTEKVKILLGHDGPEEIPKSVVLLNKRSEILQK